MAVEISINGYVAILPQLALSEPKLKNLMHKAISLSSGSGSPFKMWPCNYTLLIMKVLLVFKLVGINIIHFYA